MVAQSVGEILGNHVRLTVEDENGRRLPPTPPRRTQGPAWPPALA